MTKLPTISAVVPVYNSEESLPRLVEDLQAVFAEVAANYEIIFVNDGSSDQSWSIAEGIAAENESVRAINLMRNFGQHNALLCGIRAARFDLILTSDDDLQHPPSEIPKLLDVLTPDIDVVYGTPEHQQHGLLRNLASTITRVVLQGSMGVETARNVSAFRLFRTRVRDAFTAYQSPLVSIDVLLTWGTSNFRAVRVRHEPRQFGQSNYTVRKLITHAINMLTGFTTLPLQLASILGFVSAAFGLLLLIFVVGRFLIEGRAVPGFAFLASSIALFAGVQLFALGIVGEYLARIHLRTMDKPPYVIREDTNNRPAP